MKPRSLYTKIFLWFCLTIAASTLLVIFVALITGSQPFGRRWMAVTQDLYAHSAVDFYSTGGQPELNRYLTTIRRSTGIAGHLFRNPASEHATDVSGQPAPAHTLHVFREALATNESAARLGRYWTAASVITAPDQTRYMFVMEAFPLRGFLDGTFLTSMAPRLAAGLLLVAGFCLLLARHITRPIRVLQLAATQMAAGNLSARTLPALGSRTDELAAMAAAFDSMAARIETLLHMQRQMLADISHELRSPLTRISVSLELLRRGETDVLETMQQDLDRLNEMIGQVLELTRFDLQEQPLAQYQVELVSLLEDLLDSANHEGRARGITVTLAAPSTCIVPGDEALLRSAIENIIRNALQHAPLQSTVSLTLTRGAQASLRIDDDGSGVPAAALPNLFAPFFRVPQNSGVHSHGTGLGLSISARIVERHAGTVTAVNRSPQGLSVILTLPTTSS